MVIYMGNDVFKINKGESFNLYRYENINIEQSKISIQKAFEKRYKNKLIKILNQIGLSFKGFDYYSPNEYNFEGDSLDLIVGIIDKHKFKEYILKYKEEIQKELDKNKSYDGYIALTVKFVEQELEELKKDNYEPDVIVLRTILNKLIDFSDFSPQEYLIYEGDEYGEC